MNLKSLAKLGRVIQRNWKPLAIAVGTIAAIVMLSRLLDFPFAW